MHLGTVTGVTVPLITFVLMTVVGADLRADDFRRLRGRSRLVWAGLLAPPLLLPPLALGLVQITRPPAPVAMGLLLVAVCPAGGISNSYAYLARASTALSVTLTGLSCLLAVVTMPAVGAVLGTLLRQPLMVRIPVATLLLQILAMVALPAWLGMRARHGWPDIVARLQPAAWRAAFVLLGLLLALVILADVPGFLSALPETVPLAAVFIVCSFLVGGAVAHACGGEFRDRVTLAVGFATRNVAVATTTAVTVMGRVDFATFGTTYFLTEVPLMLAAAVILRRAAARQETAAVPSASS